MTFYVLSFVLGCIGFAGICYGLERLFRLIAENGLPKKPNSSRSDS